jgi:DNA-directed RNA polymerase I, II, and III subunit RPABC2
MSDTEDAVIDLPPEDEVPVEEDKDEDVSDSEDSADEEQAGLLESIVESLESSTTAADTLGLISPDKRSTLPVLSTYEKAKIVGLRAQMIDDGSPLLITPTPGVTDPIQLALMEVRAKRSPVVIKRVFTDGSYEEWRLHEMVVVE